MEKKINNKHSNTALKIVDNGNLNEEVKYIISIYIFVANEKKFNNKHSNTALKRVDNGNLNEGGKYIIFIYISVGIYNNKK